MSEQVQNGTCWQRWRLYRCVTAATCVLIFSRTLSCCLTIFPTVYFHAPPTTASILRLGNCFSPNNASAVLPYAALAMVQRSCRWLTAALTIQLAASLKGLKSVGCIKVRREEKRRILTSSRFRCRLFGDFGLKRQKHRKAPVTDAPVVDVARFQQQLESTMQRG